jgi:hypothetical protein
MQSQPVAWAHEVKKSWIDSRYYALCVRVRVRVCVCVCVCVCVSCTVLPSTSIQKNFPCYNDNSFLLSSS